MSMQSWSSLPANGCSRAESSFVRSGCRLFLLWVMVAGLVACSPADPANALLQDYVERVARVVEADRRELSVAGLEGWPRRRDRLLDIPRQRTGLGQFLSLHRCDLGTLIGERSSQLGRVMTASQQLHYEHRFLLVAQQCLDRLAGDEGRAELRAALAGVVAEKRDNVPRLAWNATLAHDALAGAHALQVAALDPEAAALAGAAATGALQLLAERLPLIGTPALITHEWDAPWETLGRSEHGGAGRRALVLLTATMTAVADMLEQRQVERPLCPQGRPTPRAETLNNVFTRYYAAQVQPYLAGVHRVYGGWLKALQELHEAQLVEPPPAMKRYHAEVLQAEWRTYVAARDRHTQVWQEVLQHCNLAPQPPGRQGQED